MVAKGHQVQLSGPGCAHDDVLVVQAQIRLAPREVVREDEETHAADSGSERVERPAVVLRLERLQPANVERHGRHRRLVDLPRQLGLFCDDRGAKDEVAAELRFRCFEVRELLPVPAEVGIVGRLERVGTCLFEQRSSARKYRPPEAGNLFDGSEGRLELKAPELIDVLAFAVDQGRVERELCPVPRCESAPGGVLEHLVAEAA